MLGTATTTMRMSAYYVGRLNLINEKDLVYRLRKRAEIRRQIPSRKSVQEGAPDRIADLLEEAAREIEQLRQKTGDLNN